jgi:hypothetical protein
MEGREVSRQNEVVRGRGVGPDIEEALQEGGGEVDVVNAGRGAATKVGTGEEAAVGVEVAVSIPLLLVGGEAGSDLRSHPLLSRPAGAHLLAVGEGGAVQRWSRG